MSARKPKLSVRSGAFSRAAVGSLITLVSVLLPGRFASAEPATTPARAHAGDAAANPFRVDAGKTQPNAKAQPTSSSNRPIYQNPFADAPDAPPIEPTAPDNLKNRWQRPTIPRWVATASEPPLVASPVPVSPRQPGENTSSLLTALAAPDRLIRTAPTQLAQPESVDTTGLQIGGLTTSSTIAPPAPMVPEFEVSTLVAGADESPASWLGQAQDAASHATAIDDFSHVVRLCERGLHGTPTAQQSTSLRKLSAWAYNRRGEAFASTEHLDDALNDFQSAIALDPQSSLAIHNRGVTFAERNQYAAALRDFNRVIELNPGLAIAYRNRAELLTALGRMQAAVADYNRAIETIPNETALYLARAQALQRLCDFAGAAADLDRALKLSPNDAGTLTQRGNLAAEQGEFAAAERDFRAAIAANPNLVDAHRSLAWLQATCPDQRFRNAEEALSSAERAVQLSTTRDYQALEALAAAHACAGRFDRAIELQQQALSLAPHDLSDVLVERLSQYQSGKSIADVPKHRLVHPVSHEMPVGQTKMSSLNQ